MLDYILKSYNLDIILKKIIKLIYNIIVNIIFKIYNNNNIYNL